MNLSFEEVWDYKDLLYFLVWRDIKVRYKQTILGISWVIIQPLFHMIILSIIFGRLAGLPSEGIPYPLFILSALLPWQLFAYALTQSTASLVADQRLVTKIYFPRIIIPLSTIFSGLLDFIISFFILLVMMCLYRVFPGFSIIYLPLFVLLALTTAMGAGLWFTALNVRYRDVRYTIPFLTQVWFYLAPVAYSITLVPEKWQALYRLNPMVGVIEGFRWALLGKTEPALELLIFSFFISLGFLASGLFYFQRIESEFADII